MTGSKPPISIGLERDKDIKAMLKVSKKLFHFLDNNMKNNPFVCSTFVLSGYYIRAELWEIIALGIPYAVMTSLWSLAWWHVVGFHVVAFYLICRYLKIKIYHLQPQIHRLCETKNFGHINDMLHRIDALFAEIDEYNDTYFSKFLLSFWLFFGSVIVLSVYQVRITCSKDRRKKLNR